MVNQMYFILSMIWSDMCMKSLDLSVAARLGHSASEEVKLIYMCPNLSGTGNLYIDAQCF